MGATVVGAGMPGAAQGMPSNPRPGSAFNPGSSPLTLYSFAALPYVTLSPTTVAQNLIWTAGGNGPYTIPIALFAELSSPNTPQSPLGSGAVRLRLWQTLLNTSGANRTYTWAITITDNVGGSVSIPLTSASLASSGTTWQYVLDVTFSIINITFPLAVMNGVGILYDGGGTLQSSALGATGAMVVRGGDIVGATLSAAVASWNIFATVKSDANTATQTSQTYAGIIEVIPASFPISPPGP